MVCALKLQAQKEFSREWQTEFPVDVEWRFINEERTLALGGDLTEIAMVDAVKGTLLWKINFKEKFGQKKAKDWNYDKKAGVVWVEVKGEKKDELKTYYIDDASGKPIGEEVYQERKQERVRSKKVTKGIMVVEEHQTNVTLEYERKLMVSSMGKGSKNKITVKATGNYQWNTTIDARYVRTLCSNAIPAAAADFGGDFLKLMYSHDKVFVIYEGLSVLDIKTGNKLWEADYDNAEFDFGVFKSTQTLGRAGYPFVDETGVYVADLSKGQHRIRKYDINTGALIWQSESFEKDDVVPDLMVLNGVLVAQFGGRLETQTYIPGVEGRPDVCKSEYKFAGNAGVRAYDVSTGKQLWNTGEMKTLGDKFNGGITNMQLMGGRVWVASDKQLYAFDEKGNSKVTVVIKSLKIGKPVYLLSYDDHTLLVEGEEGIASINVLDGKVNFSTNTGKCLGFFKEGSACYVWNGKEPGERSAFVRIDMSTGTITGKMTDTPSPYFTLDGDAFIKFEKEKITRYKTK